MNCFLMLVCVLGADPDLASYKKACLEKQKKDVARLVDKLQSATGADRAALREEIAKAKAKPPLLPIKDLEKVGQVGNIPRQLVVVDTAGPSVRAMATNGDFEMIIDGVDSRQWRKGETITLPVEQLFHVTQPMVVKAVTPTQAVLQMYAEIEAKKNK